MLKHILFGCALILMLSCGLGCEQPEGESEQGGYEQQQQQHQQQPAPPS